MNPLSQFYILSPRGDTVVNRDFRGDIPKGTAEIFFRKVKFWKGDPPPVFAVDDVSFLFIKKSGLYFVATTKFNVSPSFVLELLDRIAKLCKDYCGVLTEESIRKNFILLYELLDECLHYGYPQSLSTEALKLYVHNEPVPVEAALAASAGSTAAGVAGGALAKVGGAFAVGGAAALAKRTISSSAVMKPISLSSLSTGGGGSGGARKNEIFVDILERLTVLFNANGYVLNSSIDGCIQVKSYLSGNPSLRLALNEDLVIGKENQKESGGYGHGGYGSSASSSASVVLDDANFHECVSLDDFDSTRTLALTAIEGELVLMNYRIASSPATAETFRPPFRVFPTLEETSPFKVELVLRVRADIPEQNHGTNVTIRFPVPKSAAAVVPELVAGGSSVGSASYSSASSAGAARGMVGGAASAAASSAFLASGQSVEFLSKEKEVVWTIKKFQGGGTEHTLRTKITLASPSTPAIRKELGPVSVGFEIPMFNASSLQVRYLRIAENATTTSKGYKPHRWVRYVTTSNSYVVRL